MRRVPPAFGPDLGWANPLSLNIILRFRSGSYTLTSSDEVPPLPPSPASPASRFNPDQQPQPEWLAFGSYCFALPLIEFTEAGDACLLAATLAWDQPAGGSGSGAADSVGEAESGAAAGSVAGAGSASVYEAGQAVLLALGSLQPPALPSAYALHLTRSVLVGDGTGHAPSFLKVRGLKMM